MTMHKFFSFAALTATFVLLSPIEGQAETTGPDPNASIYIISPTPNAYYPDAPATIDAEISVSQGEFQIVDSVELFVDGVSFGVEECFSGCTFVSIELALGVHELRAQSNTGADDLTTVYVGEEPPEPSDTGDTTTGDGDGDSTDSSDSDSSDSSGDSSGESEGDTGESGATADEVGEGEGTGSGADDSASGSGCEVDSEPSPWSLLALPMLLLIPAIRRRD